MIWWIIACFGCLAIGTALGIGLIAAFTSGKMEDARAPTLIGHRPGVKTSRQGDEMIWTPYCLCGWEGPTYGTERGARVTAEDHAKGFV